MFIASRLTNNVEIRQPTADTGYGVYELLLTNTFKAPPEPDDDLSDDGWLLATTFSDELEDHRGGKAKQHVYVKFDPDDYTAAAAVLDTPVLINDTTPFFVSIRRAAIGAGDPGAATPLKVIVPFSGLGGAAMVIDSFVTSVLHGIAPANGWIHCPLPMVCREMAVSNLSDANSIRVALVDPTADNFIGYDVVATESSETYNAGSSVWLYGVGGVANTEIKVISGH